MGRAPQKPPSDSGILLRQRGRLQHIVADRAPESNVSRKRQAELDFDQCTRAEVYAAIRYLDPTESAQNDDAVASVISFAVFVLVAAGLGFIWLYRW